MVVRANRGKSGRSAGFLCLPQGRPPPPHLVHRTDLHVTEVGREAGHNDLASVDDAKAALRKYLD
jgi:hypothetical protein